MCQKFLQDYQQKEGEYVLLVEIELEHVIRVNTIKEKIGGLKVDE